MQKQKRTLKLIREVGKSLIYCDGDNKLIVETATLHCDTPTMNTEGKVKWQSPTAIPHYLRDAIKAEFNKAKYSNDYRS